MEGWASFHRTIFEWEWYTDSNTFRLFFHLVLKANNMPGKWRGVQIERGQHLTSTAKLSDALKLSNKQIRLSLKKLESTGEVAIKTTNKYTLVTIVKYNLYQDTNKKRANKKEHEGQSKGKQRATNNNEDNENNEKKVQIPLEIAINEFINFRKKIKNPMTDKAIELLKTRLDKLTNDEEIKIAILEQSIMNGWKGIFELKDVKPKSNSWEGL